MGLANLVPGVSGGTMLLAVGVYPRFIGGIAELTRLRIRFSTIGFLATIVAAGGLSILLLAGPTKDLVVHQRWIMYSLFIGLTLGGVPIVWKLIERPSTATWLGATVGIAIMAATLLVKPAAADGGGAALMLFFAGLAGASAMILPGVSGGYLLLVLGQYVPILAAVDLLKQGLLGGGDGGGPDTAMITRSLATVIPVGLGVLAGVLGVSNLLEWMLARFRAATLGFLLGLLLGAVLGLWPFQRPVPPVPGDVIKGVVLTEATVTAVDPDDHPVERFPPTPGQIAACLALIAAGFGATALIGRVKGSSDGDARA